MPVAVDVILESLAERGLRNTAPRRAIADWLSTASNTGRDFSADDVWQELLSQSHPGGRATVFRTLDALERSGVLDRIELANGNRRYRVCGAAEHHHHIVCVACGKVSDVHTCLPRRVLSAIAEETGFVVERHSLELFGRCGSCLQSAPETTGAT
jgi:Fur family ferric uptake transcriptional regulator